MRERREFGNSLIDEHRLSQRRACELVGMSRSQFRYTGRKQEDGALVREIIKIKTRRPCYGLPRVEATLRRRGHKVNGKKIYRILKILNLLVPRRMKRKYTYVPPRLKIPEAIRLNDVWAMNFVFDTFADGSSFRCFTMIDVLSREVPGIFANRSMAAFSPIDFLEKLKSEGTLPKHFVLDNGPEFTNRAFVTWCEQNNISLHFIDPGKPVQNAYIESFNGKFRKEFLQQTRFRNISQLRTDLEKWTSYYNEERPHSSLDYLTPKEFAAQERAVLDPKINLLVLKTG